MDQYKIILHLFPKALSAVACIALLSACDPDSEPENQVTDSDWMVEESQDGPDSVVENTLEAVAELEFEPGHVLSFYVEPSTSGVMITEVNPPGSVNVVVSARQAGATSLEVYRAIAPDAAVPRELEVAHLAEIREQGRGDAGVRPLPLAPAPMEDDPPCLTEATFDDWFAAVAWYPYGPNGMDSFSGSGPTFFTLSELTTTYEDALVAGCNKDGDVKQFKHCYIHDNRLFCTAYTNVSAGSTWTYGFNGPAGADYYHQAFVNYPSGASGTSRLAWQLDNSAAFP